jgi:hypothetical protein
MTLRHILEYEDYEIQDLLGDLEEVGQAKKYIGTLWARFSNYPIRDDYWSNIPEYVCFLKTDPIYSTGNEDKDKTIMLEKIQKGAFVRPNDPDARNLKTLEEGNPMAMQILEKQSVQSLSQTCSTIDELTSKLSYSLMKTQKVALAKFLINAGSEKEIRDSYILVLTYGFLAPEGSPYLVTSDMDLPIKKGDTINWIG